MKARVKKNARWNSVRVQGRDYIKDEYREVPEDAQAVAKRPEYSQYLEFQAGKKKAAPKKKPTAKKS